ncbi:MAG TPA: twin-arginine translocase TatA/TatE family subunit [Terriglobales bacterium]|nr:twin-arginine translocase TatA/TatE family subunit [Terriglobales bacterium]
MNLGFPEMIFLFLLALIIFGPKKMPEIGRQIGRALNEFKRASNEFKAQIESEINQLELQEHQIMPPSQPPVGSVPAYQPPVVEAEAVPVHEEISSTPPPHPEQAALPETSVVEGPNA